MELSWRLSAGELPDHVRRLTEEHSRLQQEHARARQRVQDLEEARTQLEDYSRQLEEDVVEVGARMIGQICKRVYLITLPNINDLIK